jgi:hypothetical protein
VDVTLERVIAGTSLFADLDPSERAQVAALMHRRDGIPRAGRNPARDGAGPPARGSERIIERFERKAAEEDAVVDLQLGPEFERLRWFPLPGGGAQRVAGGGPGALTLAATRACRTPRSTLFRRGPGASAPKREVHHDPSDIPTLRSEPPTQPAEATPRKQPQRGTGGSASP